MRAMKHPDIAVGIRGSSPDTTQQQMVRHRGEMRVHFENRQDGFRIRPLVLRDGGSLELRPAEKGHQCDSRQRCAREDVPFHVTDPSSAEQRLPLWIVGFRKTLTTMPTTAVRFGRGVQKSGLSAVVALPVSGNMPFVSHCIRRANVAFVAPEGVLDGFGHISLRHPTGP